MTQFRWPDVPADVRAQVDALVERITELVGDELVGVYLHGSLVLGCFNPQRSDLDVLAVARRALAPDKKRRLARAMLDLSGPKAWPRTAPYPLEISLLNERDLRPWRYPPRYELHFGESHRALVEAGKVDAGGEDADLAAHITVLHHAGAVAAGAPIADVFPPVPHEDYVASLHADLDWCREKNTTMYAVLSASRVWATVVERRVHSKDSGALWARRRVPAEYAPLIDDALAVYRGDADTTAFDREAVRRYAQFVSERVHEHAR
jgi:predicted nucleotidyltransferase